MSGLLEGGGDDSYTVPMPFRRNTSLLSSKHRLSSCRTFLRSLELPDNRHFSWTDDDEDDVDDVPSQCTYEEEEEDDDNNGGGVKEPSLAPEDLFDPPDHGSTGSGFSLFVLQERVGGGDESCDSSVTWFEGSDIDEVTVGDNSRDYEDDDDDDDDDGDDSVLQDDT